MLYHKPGHSGDNFDWLMVYTRNILQDSGARLDIAIVHCDNEYMSSVTLRSMTLSSCLRRWQTQRLSSSRQSQTGNPDTDSGSIKSVYFSIVSWTRTSACVFAFSQSTPQTYTPWRRTCLDTVKASMQNLCQDKPKLLPHPDAFSLPKQNVSVYTH